MQEGKSALDGELFISKAEECTQLLNSTLDKLKSEDGALPMITDESALESLKNLAANNLADIKRHLSWHARWQQRQ